MPGFLEEKVRTLAIAGQSVNESCHLLVEGMAGRYPPRLDAWNS